MRSVVYSRGYLLQRLASLLSLVVRIVGCLRLHRARFGMVCVMSQVQVGYVVLMVVHYLSGFVRSPLGNSSPVPSVSLRVFVVGVHYGFARGGL